METKLKKIFDYQRFEENTRLKNMCDSVEKKFAELESLSDDELYMVVAGRTYNSPDNHNPLNKNKKL